MLGVSGGQPRRFVGGTAGQEAGGCAVRGENSKMEEQEIHEVMEVFAGKYGSPYPQGNLSKI